MIKRFSPLYTGHVLEGEGIGFEGTPANDRRYANERLSEAFAMSKDLAQHVDGLGYDTLWMAEHHFQPEGYECIPNLLMLSLWLAQHTKNIKFGCAFNILPMWHPLRLAEDFAMADLLTNGRVVFGVGRGYHTREVETFGAPMEDPDANRELFEEQLEVVMKAFNEESFSHHGKHYPVPPEVPYRGYQLKKITMVPRPSRLPVETWQPIVSGSLRGFDFMAKHGLKGIIMGTAAEHMDKMVHAYQEANARYGRSTELGEGLALGVWWRIDDSRQEARRWLQPAFEEHVKFAAPLGMLRYSNEQMEALGPGGVASHIAAGGDFEDVLNSGAWFCDTPEAMTAFLKEIEVKYPGVEQIILPCPFGWTTEQSKQQFTRFAEEVMPAFIGRR